MSFASTMSGSLCAAHTRQSPAIAAILIALCLAAVGGCSKSDKLASAGARNKVASAEDDPSADDKQNEKDAAEKEKEKKKPPYEITRLSPLLSESIVDSEEGRPIALAKPGHWTATIQQMTASAGDLEGRTTLSVVDAKGNLVALPHTPFDLTSSRPAVLAKDRTKRIESEILIPESADKPHVAAELVNSATAAVVDSSPSAAWRAMPSSQYFFLVLAREPARYAYLKVTDSVRAPYEDENGASPPHYRVVLADGNKPLPLPSSALAWTSVAYVLWDEVNLDRIDPAEQQALVDWLHWGGRLIVNGPDSLDALRSSFLAKYLPVDPGKTRTLTSADLLPFSAVWGRRPNGQPPEPLAAKKPWSGIELKIRPLAKELPGAAGLFYEGVVGSGSIVVSGVRLTERDFVNWRGFDGFLNGGLLRRPGRSFRVEKDGQWTGLQTDWAEYENRARDAHFTTPLRWFARDAGAKANTRQEDQTQSRPPQPSYFGGIPLVETKTVTDQPGGLGQWSEFGLVSKTAREALHEAAGVRVPAASFVIACLALYLIVLVPLNWMVFHALRRVEWAWIAAPVIALLGTIGVVRQAQLDIGFVRSQTEIAVLELQGDHPRGHLSRYSAFYTSLSSAYDIAFDDPTAVATPFPSDDAEADVADLQTLTTVTLENYDKPRLHGLSISSASTQFVHSEEMYPLAGPLRLTSASGNPNLQQVDNKSGFDLSDATIIRRRFDVKGRPADDACWLGQVASGSSVLLHWAPIAFKRDSLPFAADRQKAAAVDTHKRLDVDKLLALAFAFPADDDPLAARRDEYRLVARIDEILPGAHSTPAASQSVGTTIVLAHLQLGLAPSPTPDANSPTDVLPEGKRRNAYQDDEAPDAASGPSTEE